MSRNAGEDAANELTMLLNRARGGDAAADAGALSLVYGELKKIAAAELRRQARGSTLNTTAVVHEAYAKLAGCDGSLVDRKHYFRLAALAMRQVVVDHARARLAEKRGGDVVHVDFELAHGVAVERAQDLIDLDEALTLLAADEPRAAQVVELHVYGGMTFDQVADALGISERTARSDWTYARAVLATHLEPE